MEIFNLKQELSVRKDDSHYDVVNDVYLNSLQNKIKNEQKNVKISQEQAQDLKVKLDSMNKITNEMRMQYLREIQHLREMIYRKDTNPANILIDDAHYFSTSEGFDRETQRLLNIRIMEVKNQNEKIVSELKNTINELKNKLVLETERSEKMNRLKMDEILCLEIEVLCKKVLEKKNSPILVWNYLIQLFGKEFFKTVILNDFEEPKKISEIMKSEFDILKNSMKEQIQLLESQFIYEINNLKLKNESLNNQINDILFNNDKQKLIPQKLSELRLKTDKLNKLQDENQRYKDEISQLKITISKIQSEISDKFELKEKFSKHLFSILSESLKMKSIISLSNSVNKSFQKAHKKIHEKKIPEDQNDFSNYLEGNSFLKSVFVQTDTIQKSLRRKSKDRTQNPLLNIITSPPDNNVYFNSTLTNKIPEALHRTNENSNDFGKEDSFSEVQLNSQNNSSSNIDFQKLNLYSKNKEFEKDELRKSEIAFHNSEQKKKKVNKLLNQENGGIKNKSRSKKKSILINQNFIKTNHLNDESIKANIDNLSVELEIIPKRKSLSKKKQSINEIINERGIGIAEKLDLSSTFPRHRNNNKLNYNKEKISKTFNSTIGSKMNKNERNINQSHSWIKNHQSIILEKITRYAKHYTINNHSKVREIRQKIFLSQNKQKNA